MAGGKRRRPGEITGAKRRRIIRALWRAARGVCTYCMVKMRDVHEATIDHKVPLSKGGSSELPNLTLSCVTCNLDKGSETFEDYMWRRYE